MRIPIIEKRKVIAIKRRDGRLRYLLTLPKEYAASLRAEGVETVYVICNRALVALPANTATEEDLIAFLKVHPELEKLLTKNS